MRTRVNFNQDWFFSKTSEVPKDIPTDWECVILPHTWNALDGQDGGNDYWRGTAMYAKEFSYEKPLENKKIFLEFQGAAMSATVFLNGKELTKHEEGFSLFRVELTDALQQNNLLCVSVDNSENDFIYPQKADFTFYGGIYRNVDWIEVPGAHFELVQDGTPGIRVTPEINGNDAQVKVEVWTCGGDTVQISLENLTQMIKVEDNYASAVFNILDVHLWNGLADPYLYVTEARLIDSNKEVDKIQTRFGCRTIEFSPKDGFILNGRSYPLRGVARHQDYIGIGNAITTKEMKQDIEIIQELGANTIRLAHYQHAQEFYDLCDELGLIVWAEIPYITKHMKNGRQNTLNQMRQLVIQSYNHPSIVCWGLSNEITASSKVDDDVMENHRLLNELCHKLDPTRKTVIAHAFMLEQDSPLIQLADLATYNLYFGWYIGEISQNGKFFDDYHRTYPNRLIGFSEYGADANPDLHSASPEKGDYSEEYQCVYHEALLECIEERPFIWASHVWNLFDFAADGRDEGGKNGINQKGLVTFDRKVKKDAFYLYKAAWSQKPFVHLCGRRYLDHVEENIEIKVYSNQREVCLYVDGKFFEKRYGDRIFVFHVPIVGKHKIEAKSGELTDVIEIRRVDEPNVKYSLNEKAVVVNWFEKDGIKTDYYSIKDTYGDLMKNKKTKPFVHKIMDKAIASRGDVAKSAMKGEGLLKMISGLPLESLLKQARDAISDKEVVALNETLQKIKK